MVFLALILSISFAGVFSTTYMLKLGGSYVLSVEQGFIVAFALFYCQPRQIIQLLRQNQASYLCLFALLVLFLFSSSYIFPPELSPLDSNEAFRFRRFKEISGHIAFGLGAHFCLKNQTNSRLAVTCCMILVSLIACGIIVYVVYEWFHQACDKHACLHWEGHFPVFEHARHMGETILPLAIIPTCLLFMQRGQNLIYQLFLITASALGVGALVWLGGRGSLLAAIIPIGLLLYCLTKHQRLNYQQFVFWVIACAITIIIAEHLANMSFLGLSRWSAFTADDATLKSFSSSRTVIWSVTIEIIKASPWFGYGGDGYLLHPYIEPLVGFNIEHAHNFILQTGLEVGLLGIALIAVLCVLSIIKFWSRRHKKSIYEYTALLVFIGFVMNSLTGATFFAGITQLYAVLLIAIFNLELREA